MKKQYQPQVIFILSLLAGGLVLACGQVASQTTDGTTPRALPSQTDILQLESPRAETAIPEDCHKIAFTLTKEGTGDIYTVCPDGSQLQNLTNHPSADTHPAWSPDGSQIAFASSRAGSMHIFVMNSHGSGLVQISSDFENGYPIWLPSGEQIAFRTTDGKGLWWWRQINLATKEITNLSEPSYDFFYQTPSWSPDGEWIAYMSLEEQKQRNDGSSQIHIKKADSTVDIALTKDTWANITPVWSPDGSKIAFLSERDGIYNSFALYIMNRDGTMVRKLTNPVFSENALYSWSPDGEYIVIGGEAPEGHLFVVHIHSGFTKVLMTPSSGEWVSAPSWQP